MPKAPASPHEAPESRVEPPRFPSETGSFDFAVSGAPGRAESDPPELPARRLRLALVVSVLLNVLGLVLFWRLLALSPQALEPRSHTEVVTIEKKRRVPVPVTIVPRVAVRPKPIVQPRPVPQPVAAAPAPAPVAPRVPPHPLPPRAVPRKAELAKNPGGAHAETVPHRSAPGTVAAERPQLSAQKIARIEQDLQGEIDADRGSHAPLAVAPEPAPTLKHYAVSPGDLDLGGIADHHGHGLCDPVRDWKDGGFNYYYVACNVHVASGFVERQSVPWPVRFAPNDDPFAGTTRKEKPLAMPLPGWTLPAGETVSEELRTYAHEHGVDI